MGLRAAVLSAVVLAVLAAPVAAAKPEAPEARIDNSSIEAFHASWDQLYKSLSRSEQQQLQFAVIRIALGHYQSAFDVPNDLSGIRPETIRNEVDGMTYAEIIALANKSSVTVESLPPCGSRKPLQQPCVK
jgi:hypothetical protein